MHLTRTLSRNDLRAKLASDGLIEHRPGLALAVLSGDCPYVERSASGEETTFTLDGAPMTRSAPTSASREISDEEASARLDKILQRHVAPASVPAAPATVQDASAELVRAAGGVLSQPAPQSAPEQRSDDAGAELVRLALVTDEPSTLDHLFPEPPSAA